MTLDLNSHLLDIPSLNETRDISRCLWFVCSHYHYWNAELGSNETNLLPQEQWLSEASPSWIHRHVSTITWFKHHDFQIGLSGVVQGGQAN